MTDADVKIDDEAAAELIATHYLTSVDEVVEHLRAADQLGLGVRVSSYLVADEDGLGSRWELELLTTSPVHHEDETETETEAV